MRVALGIEYDGTRYHGWQSQQNVVSIQEKLEQATSSVANHPIKIICAGRTDKGVHAFEQVIHFETEAVRDDKAWVMGINNELPNDIRVLWAKKVSDEFHARFSATARTYQYRIYNRPVKSSIMCNYTVWAYHQLDETKMHEAAQVLVGKHDFNAYRATGCQAKNPVRNVSYIDVKRDDYLITIDIKANAFLHHMVRNIAGVLMEIGQGKRPVEWAKQVLESQDRRQGGITAEPQGLFLVKIDYDEIV